MDWGKGKGKGKGKAKHGPNEAEEFPALTSSRPGKATVPAPVAAKAAAPSKASSSGFPVADTMPPPKAPAASASPPTAPAANTSPPTAHAASPPRAPVVRVSEGSDLAHLELKRSKAAFGTKGEKIRLMANHFVLSIVKGCKSKWMAWQVEVAFAPAAEASAQCTSKGKGKMRSSEGKEAPAPGRGLRQAAMKEIMSGRDQQEWLYDGSNRLYTQKEAAQPQAEGQVEVTAAGRRSNLLLKISKAEDQQKGGHMEIDLSWLGDLGRHAPSAEAVAEQSRLLMVALRNFAMTKDELLARGRRILCPQASLLGMEEMSLLHGRELWWGYLAQVELVDSAKGAKCTLSLNMIATVGLPEMPAMKLVAHLLEKNRGDAQWFENEFKQNKWPTEWIDQRLLAALNSPAGLQKVRVQMTHLPRGPKSLVGISPKSASQMTFKWEQEKREVTVQEYFEKTYKRRLLYPNLPCLMVGKSTTFIPMEFVTVLGGEHNLLVGKLKPEYQKQVTRITTMAPKRRRDAIRRTISSSLGPVTALREKGVEVDVNMMEIAGRILPSPVLADSTNIIAEESRGQGTGKLNNYSAQFHSISPPNFEVKWRLWNFCPRDRDHGEAWGFVEALVRTARQRNIRFHGVQGVETPAHTGNYWGKSRESLEKSLLLDLETLKGQIHLLVILVPDKSSTKDLYNVTKRVSELQVCNFATQFVVCEVGAKAAEQKLNNLMLKVVPKLSHKEDGSGASHNVRLRNPHWLLQSKKTMVMGADVTHNVVGISVAGLVASRDDTFSNYFNELRGQAPWDPSQAKTRRRKSEERILDLRGMSRSIIQRWRDANGQLPDVILYYRDGVSDGQFFDVLTRELNLLVASFNDVLEAYHPKLAIIVGQKRHQTRFFTAEVDDTAGKSQGKGGKNKGGKIISCDDGQSKGKGKGDSNEGQVPPGTVAGEGISQPGHLNFFLVAHRGIKGTSVPCHYHVLHLDERLQIGVDDLEQITYELCHMYTRADKTVGYASPTYLADHLCERGKLYMESVFEDDIEERSSVGGTSDNSAAQDQTLRKEIDRRVKWLNDQVKAGNDSLLQGRNYFC